MIRHIFFGLLFVLNGAQANSATDREILNNILENIGNPAASSSLQSSSIQNGLKRMGDCMTNPSKADCKYEAMLRSTLKVPPDSTMLFGLFIDEANEKYFPVILGTSTKGNAGEKFYRHIQKFSKPGSFWKWASDYLGVSDYSRNKTLPKQEMEALGIDLEIDPDFSLAFEESDNFSCNIENFTYPATVRIDSLGLLNDNLIGFCMYEKQREAPFTEPSTFEKIIRYFLLENSQDNDTTPGIQKNKPQSLSNLPFIVG